MLNEPYVNQSKSSPFNQGILAFGRNTKKSRKSRKGKKVIKKKLKASKKKEKMCLCPCPKDIKAYGKKSKSEPKVIKMIRKKASEKGTKLTQKELANLLSKKSKTKSKLD